MSGARTIEAGPRERTAIDLFSGAAGGWTLGLHRAGVRTIAACESDPWRRATYQRRWSIPVYDDVRTLTDHGSIFGDTVQSIEGYEAFRAERVAAMRCAIEAVPCMLCALGFAPFNAEKIMWHQVNGRDPFRCTSTGGPDGR